MSSSIKRFTEAFSHITVLAALGVLWGASQAAAVTTFLHHFDVGNPINGGAGTADYAVGNPEELILPPSGPGGLIVPGGKFGNGLDHSTGGRIEYATAGNYSVSKGTIEMWIKGPGINAPDFKGLWGTDTSSGAGDIRMYIYNDQVNDNLRSLGAYQNGAGGSHWEIEQPIPVGNMDDASWHHVAWEYDTTPGSEVTALWWDGILLANVADDGSVINPRTSFSATRMHIGENQAGSAPWPGMIDEVRISNHLVYDTNNSFTPPTAPFQAPATGVAGDYNNNGVVDAADYVLWRNGGPLQHDATPGVQPGDYDVWKANFGLTGGSGSAAAAPVPEPAGAFSAVLAVFGLLTGSRRRHPRRGAK